MDRLQAEHRAPRLEGLRPYQSHQAHQAYQAYQAYQEDQVHRAEGRPGIPVASAEAGNTPGCASNSRVAAIDAPVKTVRSGRLIIDWFFDIRSRIGSKSGTLRIITFDPSRIRIPPAVVAPVATALGVCLEGRGRSARLSNTSLLKGRRPRHRQEPLHDEESENSGRSRP